MQNLNFVKSIGVPPPIDQNKSVVLSSGVTLFDSSNPVSNNIQLFEIPDLKTLTPAEIIECAVKYDLLPQAYVSGYSQTIHTERQVECWDKEKEVHGVFFYKKFLYSGSNDHGISLQDKYGEDLIHKFVIAVHRRDQKGINGQPISKFAVLPSALDYLPWMNKKPFDLRNDFEYIIQPMRKLFIELGGGLQDKDEDYAQYGITKDYFITNYNNEEKLMIIISKLIDEYQRIMGTINLERDVVLWSSSGLKPDGSFKFSYHIIFPNCFMSYEDCKMLRNLLVEHMEPILKYKMIDPKVYLSKQQLRLPFNEKLGSGRIKNLADLVYHGRRIKHKTLMKPLDENHLTQMIFLESVIGFKHSPEVVDKVLDPSVYSHIEVRPINNNNVSLATNNYENYDLTEDDYNEIVDLIKTQPWIKQFNILPHNG